MFETTKAVAKCLESLTSDIHSAIKYLAPNYVVKVTHVGRQDKRSKQAHVVATFGRPNYKEREFIKLAKKANEPFPIKKIQLIPYPKKRK